jgi:RNA polymerase sigma-70 factor (ECF subfamily)
VDDEDRSDGVKVEFAAEPVHMPVPEPVHMSEPEPEPMPEPVPVLEPVPAPARARVPEDAVPLALLAKGDRRGAVTAMMAAHEETVFAYCVRELRDRELAEDVAQQVFTEAHRDLARFRGEATLRTWLIGIAHHRCGDAIKARARRSSKIELDLEKVEDHVDPGSAPTEKLDQARLVSALEGCLHELSPEIRETVLLRFVSGMTYEEMAPMLGRKADTLCVRVARALPILKRCLERKGWKHE